MELGIVADISAMYNCTEYDVYIEQLYYDILNYREQLYWGFADENEDFEDVELDIVRQLLQSYPIEERTRFITPSRETELREIGKRYYRLRQQLELAIDRIKQEYVAKIQKTEEKLQNAKLDLEKKQLKIQLLKLKREFTKKMHEVRIMHLQLIYDLTAVEQEYIIQYCSPIRKDVKRELTSRVNQIRKEKRREAKQKVVKRVAELFYERKLTRKQIAKMLNISESTVKRYLRQYREMYAET